MLLYEVSRCVDDVGVSREGAQPEVNPAFQKKERSPASVLANSDCCSAPNHLRYTNLSCKSTMSLADAEQEYWTFSQACRRIEGMPSARAFNGEHYCGVVKHRLAGAVRQDKRRAQGPYDCIVLRTPTAAAWDDGTICTPDHANCGRTVFGDVN
jgi:hypothetical protein